MRASLRTLSYIPIIWALLFLFDKYYLEKCYIFKPERLQELSQAAIDAHPDQNATAIMVTLVDKLREEYGEKHVNPFEKDKWVFNNAVRPKLTYPARSID